MAEVDYYSIIEAAVMTKLRTLAIFPHEWQVSDSEENIRRGANYFAVFLPSVFQSIPVDGKDKVIVWSVLFDFYARYTTKQESKARFKAGRAELFTLNKDRMLNRTVGVFDVNLSATSELLQDIAGDNPNFIIQTFNAAVSQRIRFVT